MNIKITNTLDRLNKKKIFLIFLIFLLSRLIPHPPNFTALLALSFYIPIVFGTNYIFILLISFAASDLIFGYHNVMFFTWGSIVLIGFAAKYFSKNILIRFFGLLLASCLFFILTNFGFWLTGYYGYHMESFYTTYVMAIPFFNQTLLSTFIYSLIGELMHLFYKKKNFLNFNFK